MAIPNYQFGLNPQEVATALRNVADRVEAGELIPQEMSDVTASNIGDFVFRKVFVKMGLRKLD